MEFQVDTSSRLPIYRQLAHQIREAVARGKLRRDERLRVERFGQKSLSRDTLPFGQPVDLSGQFRVFFVPGLLNLGSGFRLENEAAKPHGKKQRRRESSSRHVGLL